MYVPPAFQETDRSKLFDFVEAHSFGLLVSSLAGRLFATHLPLLVERDTLPNGRLVGHVARANPQWRELGGQEVMAVFSGPHAYISPTWYEADHVVPTWNYVAVHAYGICEIIDDLPALGTLLEQMVARYERSLPSPWKADRSTAFFEKLANMVVGFRIAITRIEGKWKLGQNHPAERREKVVRQLTAEGSGDACEIARLMAETLR